MDSKKNLKLAVICASVFLIFIVVFTIFSLIFPDFELGKPTDKPFIYEKSENLDLENVDLIYISSPFSDIVFYESEENLDATIIVESKQYISRIITILEAEKFGNILMIDIKYPEEDFGIISSKLKIGIPKSYNESLYIRGTESNILMSNCLENTFSDLSIRLTSGDIKIECAKIENLMIRSTSANMLVEKTLLDYVCLTSTSGDIKVRDICCENGHIKVRTLGKITLSYKILCETIINTNREDVDLFIPTDSIVDLYFQSTSGVLKGTFNQSPSGVYVNVSTVSGNLYIRAIL